jgi:putative nucleotidyltransferase with HDIG domain
VDHVSGSELFLLINRLIETADLTGLADLDYSVQDLDIPAVQRMIASIRRYFAADLSILRMLIEPEHVFRIVHQSGLSERGCAALRQLSAGLDYVRAIITSDDVVHARNLRDIPPALGALYQSEGIRAFIACRVKVEGVPSGILKVYSRTGRVFTQSDKRNLLLIANQLGVLLSNLRLYQKLRSQHEKIIAVLLKSLEYRDFYTQGHSARVARLSCLCAKELGLEDRAIADVRVAAMLHDVGKIAVPDDVLLKPSQLTDGDWALIKAHPVKGAELVASILEDRELVDAIMHHHERWDGTGYPCGLVGGEIPFISRILAVADSYDAMTSKRVYSRVMSHAEAITELMGAGGTKYDPAVVAAFARCLGSLPDVAAAAPRPG